MSAHPFSDAKNRVQREMLESGIPSVAVAVAREGEIVWEEAFGWADRERRIPATVHTLYCLASVSKPYTATGLMRLVELGKLDLDKPINHYLHRDSQLKVWVGDPDEATVRRVANHTSGLPKHSNSFRGEALRKKPPMEESIRRYGNIVTPPGERYCYSNIGYGILDHLIARVSGLSYSDFLRREVFLPLGMTRSAAEITPELAEFAAVRYDEEEMPIADADCDHRGASSVYSSVHDLVRFGMFHLKQHQSDQKAALSDETIETMQVPTATMGHVNPSDPNLRPRSSYGVGWVIDDDELGHRISHGGGMDGVATKLLLMPREGIVVAAVANRFKTLAYTIESEVLSTLLPDYADKLAAREERRASETPEPLNLDAAAVPKLAGDWSGAVHTYQDDLPLTLSFKPSGDIHAQLGTQLVTLVNDAKLEDGHLTGKMAGNVCTGDTTRFPRHPFHHLELDLKLRGEVLNGALINVAGCELNHWVELRRSS